MRAVFCFLLGLTAAGCFPDKSFDCGNDDHRCQSGERCLGSHCAVADATCTAGFRYTPSAGTLSGSCAVASTGDGGMQCLKDNDSCDTGDPCTINGKCQSGKCVGTPMTCPPQNCTSGIQTVQACVAGQCVATNTQCDPYFCSGNACGKSCATIKDCKAGSYCVGSHCLSCGDALTNVAYVPHFAPATAIAGVNMNQTTEDSPFLSSDGLTLLFASNRPGGQGGLDIYQATRQSTDPATPFSNVTNLGAPLNSSKDDFDPFTLDNVGFYLSSDRNNPGDPDLAFSTFGMQMFSPPDPPAGGVDPNFPINFVNARDEHPWLLGDGKRLYLQSDRYAPPYGDPFSHIYTATRANGVDPWGPVDTLPGLPPQSAWASPSVGKSETGLYLVNQSLPRKSEAAFVHLDATGAPVGEVTLLQGVDLGGGGKLSISADGCALLYSSRAGDGGDLMWASRDGYRDCNMAVCGSDDGCCPSNCSALVDSDCPYPRTITVTEWQSMNDHHHTYLLSGEKAPVDSMNVPYVATRANAFRLFDTPPNANAVAVHRYVSTSCDGKPSYRLALATTVLDPNQWKASDPQRPNETNLGYVLPSAARLVDKLYSATHDGKLCDQQILLDQTACNTLSQTMGYTCDSLFGFGLKP